MTGRSKRRVSDDQFKVNLTPLLDVVLQLITFFMMLIHFGTKLEGASDEVKLAVAPAALPGADLSLDRLTVSIDNRGGLITEGRRLEGDEALAWWSAQAKTRRSGMETLGGGVDDLPTVVVIRADKRVAYGTVRQTMAAAQELGFAHFSLVVLRTPET